MTISLNETLIRTIDQNLRASNSAFMNIYSGETGRRQPVHTVYGGAHLFRGDSAQRLGQVAERALIENAPDFVVFARAIGLPRCNELPDVLDYATGLRHRLESDADAVRLENPAAWLAHTIRVSFKPMSQTSRVIQHVGKLVASRQAQRAREDHKVGRVFN